MTNPSSSAACRQQAPNQQDLLRLLAQHFNQQVYHLAGANSSTELSNTGQQSTTTSANNTGILHHNLANFHRQQHYQVNQDSVYFSSADGRVDLTNPSGVGLIDQNSNIQPFLANQLGRSHNQPPPDNLPKAASTTDLTSAPTNRRQLDATSTSGPDGRAAQAGSQMLNPLLNSMNLFNALNCFNMTNDQFMLSLQQQYLLHAATATSRQYGFKQNQSVLVSGLHEPSRQSQHQHFDQFMQQQAHLLHQQDFQANQRGRRNQVDQSSRKAADFTAPTDDGRELLKFSINTILGGGSSVVSNQEASETRSFEGEHEASNSHKMTDGASEQERSAPNEQQLSSPECDPNVLTDLSSDSSTTNTPQPQTVATNSSGPFDYQTRNTSSADLRPRMSSLADQVARYHQVTGNAEHQSSTLVSHHSGQQHQSSLTFLAGSAAFPWTAAARGKPRRGMMRRAVFSDSQRVGLEKRFQLQKYISKPDRKKLAEKLGLRDSQVKIWFQNRRMKWRNSKERELLSAGGSREQTLPTRNNPNPDLSDVGETTRKLSSTSNGNTTT